MAEVNKRQIATGNRRLLRLAEILDVADARHRERGEPTYNQRQLEHQCGTPACAWGHYVASVPRLRREWWVPGIGVKFGSLIDDIPVAEFALSAGQKSELFGGMGCGGARTAKQAAKYIRAFVKRRSAP